MWAEARRHDKAMRDIMIDHKKRFERRKDYFERVVCKIINCSRHQFFKFAFDLWSARIQSPFFDFMGEHASYIFQVQRMLETARCVIGKVATRIPLCPVTRGTILLIESACKFGRVTAKRSLTASTFARASTICLSHLSKQMSAQCLYFFALCSIRTLFNIWDYLISFAGLRFQSASRQSSASLTTSVIDALCKTLVLEVQTWA